MKGHITLAIPVVLDLILLLFYAPTTHGFPLTQFHHARDLPTQPFGMPTGNARRTIATPQSQGKRHAGRLRRGEIFHRMNLFRGDSSAIMASMALLGSSALGMRFDRWIPSSGIPVTLTVAAIFSNLLPMVPISHPLYDFCWSWILPGSLTLLLLGSPQPTKPNSATIDSVSTQPTSTGMILPAIGRVAGPFVMASIGSILGCWVALRIAMAGSWFSSMGHARAAMSCLVASYIGGSVNLFATAKIIRAPTTLLSSMATADLLAMAVYFAFLASSLQWKWLQRAFFVEDEPNANARVHPQQEMIDTSSNCYPTTTITTPVNGLSQYKRGSTVAVVSMLLVLTGLIVGLANRMETLLRRWIPGTACGVIALVAPFLKSILFTGNSNNHHHHPTRWIQDNTSLWNSTSSGLANGFFFLFFAAIGVGIDLGATIRLGPSCLVVSLLALTLHLLVTILGSRILLPIQKWGISLDDVWIASNAAIGGPATAAAFCNRIQGQTNVIGKTMAATFWGVVGYAIGTVIGVGFFQFSGGTVVV